MPRPTARRRQAGNTNRQVRGCDTFDVVSSWDRKFPMRRWWTSTLVAISACCADPIHAQSDLISRGRNFAELVCGACHVVSDSKQTPILRDPGPPFVQIARRTSTTEDSLRTYLDTKHPDMGPSERMPNPRLADYQIDEVIAYILSLRNHS